MRKPYAAPTARFELFAPVESLSTWEYKGTISDRWWTDSNLNFWGDRPASTANGEWYIDGTATEFQNN